MIDKDAALNKGWSGGFAVYLPLVALILCTGGDAQTFPSESTIESLSDGSKKMLKELPILTDPFGLRLEIVNSQSVPQVSAFRTRVTATADHDLVVVTLKGANPEPCRLTTRISDFTALYTKEYPGGVVMAAIGEAVAINTAGNWSINPPGQESTTTVPLSEPGPVEIKVAYQVPKGTETFEVRYAAPVRGVATVPDTK